MAAPYSGRYASIRLSTGTTSVEMLGKWDLNVSFDDIDASVFGTVWKASMNGQQGWSGKFDGFFAVTTSSGQYILQKAALAQTKLQNIRFYMNSTGDGALSTEQLFFMPHYSSNVATTGAVAVTNYESDAGAYISNVSVGQDKGGLASISYDVIGYGPLALYIGTSSHVTVY